MAPRPAPVLCLLLGFYMCATAIFAAVPTHAGTVIRIDCGGYKNFTSQVNESWTSDRYYTGGSDKVVADPQLFVQLQEETLRYFPTSDGKRNCYDVPVPNGRYFIRMFFVYDNYDDNMHSPSFDVSVEGTLVFSWRSTLAKLGAYADLHAFVQDGSATSCFYSFATDSPVIGALEITQVDPLAYDSTSTGEKVILVNYGRLTAGPTPFGAGLSVAGDIGGRAWQVDDSYSLTKKHYVQTSEPIKNSFTPPNFFPTQLYQSARVVQGSGSLEYSFRVDASLDYMIWFHFAEIEPTVSSPGQRVFNISVNDQVIRSALDVFNEVGNYAAYDWNFTVANISDSFLSIKFIPILGVPMLSGLEVLAILPTELVTIPAQVSAMQDLKQLLQIPNRMGWNGDPCAPSNWDAWQGVTCYSNSDNSGLVIGRLDVASQGVKGTISSQITALDHLMYLNLSGNMIGGSIPSGLGENRLVTVDLSVNGLTGNIPESLGSPQLKQVLLNENLLEGQVPESLYSIGVHGGFVNLSMNKGLCGVPSLQQCPHFWQKSELSVGVKVGIAFGVILGLVGFALAIWIYKKKRSSRDDYNFSLPHQLAQRRKRYMMHRASLKYNSIDDVTMMRVMPSKFGFAYPMSPR